MKKVISIILMFAMLLTSFSAFAYVDYRSLPEGSDAEYLPYAENLRVTRYTPWYKAYHMQTAADEANGVRGGEGGQVITAFAVSPHNTNNVMFGVDTSGAWRSTDGGANWYQLREGSNTWAVTDIQWHPKYERVVYMAQASTTGTDNSAISKANHTGQDGIWRSRDAGVTWEQVISSNMISTVGTDVLICFDDNNNVYCLTSNGIMKSTDDGDTFNCIAKLVYTDDETKPFFTSRYNNSSYTASVYKYLGTLYVSPDGKTIIAGGYGGFDVSRDGGANWSKIEALGNDVGYSVAINPLDENHWIAITSGGSKVYKSFDAGYNWEAMSYYYYSNGGKNYPNLVKFSPVKDGKTNIHIVFYNMTTPYTYSTDMGKTWKKATLTPNDRFTPHYSGYFAEGFEMCETDPDLVYFSMGDIVYKSTNGGKTFEISCSGYSGNFVNQFYFDKDNRIWFAFTDKGLAVTDTPYDGVNLPTAHMAGVTRTSASVVIDPNDPNHIFSNSGDWGSQTLKVSFDGAKTWQSVEGADSNAHWDFMMYANDDPNTIFSYIYSSYDNGVTWVKNEKSYAAISPIDNNIRFSIQSSEKLLHYTLDGGATWQSYGTGSGVTTVCPDLFDKNVFYTGHSAGWISICTIQADGTVKRSTKKESHGIVGTDHNEMKTSPNVIVQNPKNPKHLVAGLKGTNAGVSVHGIIESIDGGESWYVVPGARGPMHIAELQFSPVSNEIFIGNCSGGTTVYEYDNYSNENKIHFDVNTQIAESVEPVIGKYGSKYTVVAPKIKNNNYEFAGYEYSAEEFIGEGKTKLVKKFYNVGDQVTFSYKDITLTAKFKKVKNEPEFTKDNEEYTETKSTLAEMVSEGSTWYKNYNSQKDGTFSLNTNRKNYITTEAFYSIDIGGGNKVTSAKLQIKANKISETGKIKIYGYNNSFDETFASFTEEKTVKSFGVSGGTQLYQKTLSAGYNVDVEIDITDFVRKQVKAGKKTALIKISYATNSSVASANKDGIVLSSRAWNKDAVKTTVTYECSDSAVELSKGKIGIEATLPMGNKKVTPVVAVYEKNNPFKLVKFEKLEEIQLDSAKETFYVAEFDASFINASKQYIKFFIISDFGTLTPITTNVTLK